MKGRIEIANIPIDVIGELNIELAVSDAIRLGGRILILYANSHSIQLANYDEKWMIGLYKGADIILCDGAGVQLGALLTKQRIPEKIAFNIWFWNFLKFIEGKFSIYLLGGSAAVIDDTALNFMRASPLLDISGYHHGYFDKENDFVNSSLIQRINIHNPDILLVGFGQPIQEKWILQNFSKLNCKVVIACGGAFDFFSGRQPVAPCIFRKLWLEWLYRLWREPKRLIWRYTVGNYRYLKLVLNQRFRS